MNVRVIMLLIALLLAQWYAAAQSTDFEIDKSFFAHPFTPNIFIPTSFLTRASQLSTVTRELELPLHTSAVVPRAPLLHRPAARASMNTYPPDCDAASVTCCNALFIATTLQHYQCLLQLTDSNARTAALAAYKTPVEDALNPGTPTESRMCLTNDKTMRDKCCELITAGDAKLKPRTCSAARLHILRYGLRVCQYADTASRSRCCGSVFYGLPGYIRKCKALVPLYVDKQAPCVFRDPFAQRRCCSRIYTKEIFGDEKVSARRFCRGGYKYAAKNKVRCPRAFSMDRCCREAGLFGVFQACNAKKRSACADSPDRNSYKKCCLEKYEVPSKEFTNCFTEPFATCQRKTWKDRTVCCAMGLRFGSHPMRNCIHQRVSFISKKNLRDVFDECDKNYLRGSEKFIECIRFPFYACWLQEKEKGIPFMSCCKKSFKYDSVGRSLCNDLENNKNDWDRVTDKYASLGRVFQELNPNEEVKAERGHLVSCRDHSASYLEQYACMSQYVFSYQLAYDVLGSDFDMVHHASTATANNQYQCAILDTDERSACCMLHYIGMSDEQLRCMNWSIKSGHELLDEVTVEKATKLKKDLKEAVSSAPVVEAGKKVTVQNRHVLTEFLIMMKWVEETVRDESEAVDKELRDVYTDFQGLFKDALNSGAVRKIWHVGRGEWSMCASVSLKASKVDMGTVYCGSIAQLAGAESEPKRNAALGWEGGAVENVVKDAAASVRTVRQQYTAAQIGVTYVDLTAGAGTTNSVDTRYSGKAVTINLFGTASCSQINLMYTCNAMCCDTYIASSWLCRSLNAYCIN